MHGTLYLIPVPIAEGGDSGDVLPQRNREAVRGIDYFMVENLRSARRFLSRWGIDKPIDALELTELNEHTSPAEIERMIAPLLAGRDGGIISEAGVPGVADPGAEVVALCHRNDIRVVPLVGPSSIVMALMASGVNGQSFAFNGYLPVKSPERIRAIRHFERRVQTERQSQLFIEAPYRNLKLFEDFLAACAPETLLTVAADLTGPDEFIRTHAIHLWRTVSKPDLNRRPAIFILG